MIRGCAMSVEDRAVIRPVPVRPDAHGKDDGDPDDAALVRLALRDETQARSRIFDRHGRHVARVLVRVLGPDGEVADLVQDVFVMAFRDLRRLDDPSALRAWLTAIAVNVARGHIRRRTRRRWLRFFAPEDLPDVSVPSADDETLEATRATYTILKAMDADESTAFALRYIDGMELTEVARACNVSLATIKRRLARAESTFASEARGHLALERWLQGGRRWQTG